MGGGGGGGVGMLWFEPHCPHTTTGAGTTGVSLETCGDDAYNSLVSP